MMEPAPTTGAPLGGETRPREGSVPNGITASVTAAARRGHDAGDGTTSPPEEKALGDPPAKSREKRPQTSLRDRPLGATIWYHCVRYGCAIMATVVLRWRATGQRNVPVSGGALLVCNHVSFFDVVFLGVPLRRPLNYMARSTLFLPGLGWFIRSVGAFPIQREGMGASGMKETLRRVRAGGIVTLFPEGTRSPDGKLGALKPGIAVLVERVGVPVIPAGLAGMFEIWPKSRLLPVPNPIRVHYGRPILPEELAGLDTQAITALIRGRMEECYREAHRALRSDMNY